MLPNLALRKTWYYINLKGKTQGKGEKQGPSVENQAFFMVQIEKIGCGHFLVHFASICVHLRPFASICVHLRPFLVQNWSIPKVTNNITQRSDTHTDHVFYVFCQKLSLVVGQNTWNMSGSKRVPGHVPGHLDTFLKNSKIHKWCQETFRNSQQQCRVLGTMFGWGWKQF